MNINLFFLFISWICLCSACCDTARIARLASVGHPDAQYEYGRRLLTGRQARKNPRMALAWLQAAAAQGDDKAWAALAVCYGKGLGTTRDVATAERYMKQAAYLGNPHACAALLHCAAVQGKTKQCFFWLKRMAQSRDAGAEYMLAQLYLSGSGVQKNERKAIDYLRHSAYHGNLRAAALLAECYQKGIGVPRNMILAEGWRNYVPSCDFPPFS